MYFCSRSSVSESYFSTSQSEYEEPFLLCKSLESESSYGFRVKLEEENNIKCFQINPIVRILNRLSVPVSFGQKVGFVFIYLVISTL